jgi:hypothetical protein
MRVRNFGTTCAIVLAMVAAAPTLFAQQTPPGRIRGQIEKIDGSAFVLKLRNGGTLNVKLADDARVSALEKATKADIKNGAFIGIAGMPEADGSVKAFSIHVFLPAQRGVVPDRHGPWDARPNSSMTNGYVTTPIVTGQSGDTVTVKYKDGEKKIVLTPDTALAAVAPGDRSELKAGSRIIIFGSEKQADGSVLAKTLYVGRNLTPAM